jgi:hypothetical protein
VSVSFLSEVENGKRSVSLINAVNIAWALGVPLSALVEVGAWEVAAARNDNAPSAEDIERLLALKEAAERLELTGYRAPHGPPRDTRPLRDARTPARPAPAPWRRQFPRPPPPARPVHPRGVPSPCTRRTPRPPRGVNPDPTPRPLPRRRRPYNRPPTENRS